MSWEIFTKFGPQDISGRVRRSGWAIAVALVWAIMSCSPANSATCAKPAKPVLPNGKSSSVGEMERTEKSVSGYVDLVAAYVDCRQKEIDSIQDDVRKAVEEADGVRNAWNAEVDKFNAK